MLLVCSVVILFVALYVHDEQVVLVDLEEEIFWPDSAFLFEDRFFFKTITPVKDFCRTICWEYGVDHLISDVRNVLKGKQTVCAFFGKKNGQLIIIAQKCNWEWQRKSFREQFPDCDEIVVPKGFPVSEAARLYCAESYGKFSYKELKKVPVFRPEDCPGTLKCFFYVF